MFYSLLKEIEPRDIILFLKDLFEKIVGLSFTVMVLKFIFCVIIEIIDF
jgi:hypothetical protein